MGEVRQDLQQTLTGLYKITDSLGVRLFWAATHPYSSWRRQSITVNDRYYMLVDLMQDIVRASPPYTFGDDSAIYEGLFELGMANWRHARK